MRTLLLVAGLGILGLLGQAGQSAAAEKNPMVVMETSMGNIKIELYADKAPITVKNFLQYVDDKHFDNTIFHRVIKDFMVQGGGFGTDKKEKKTRDPIKNESSNGLSNERGTIAMARTPAPDSASAQFFINVKDNKFLDRNQSRDGVGYCVFGKVVEGLDVVDKIRGVQTGNVRLESRGKADVHQDVPQEDVVVKTVRKAEK